MTPYYLSDGAEWREASRSEPCPVCEKPDWCSLTGPEGAIEAVVCMREESDNRRGNGGWLHRLCDGTWHTTPMMPQRQYARRTAPKPSESAGKAYPSARDAVAELERRFGERSLLWAYHDAQGGPVGVVVRWDLPDGKKTIRPVAKHPDGWRLGGMPEPRPLYRLPDLTDAHTVYIVEGEKAADAARSIGLCATTSAHGSKSANQTDWSPLAGKEVVVLPDHDKPGAEYADVVVALLGRLSPAPSVRVVTIDHDIGGKPLPQGADLADWIDRHGDATTPETMAENIEALVAAVEPIDPQSTRPARPERYEPFPVETLPEPARSFVENGAKSIGSDPSFVALPVLVQLAAAIGTTRRLEVKRGWSVLPILWAASVGESGSSKTPTLSLALRPLEALQHQALAEHAQQLREYEGDLADYDRDYGEWKRSKGSGGPVPERPVAPEAKRLMVGDTTVEAMAPILAANPRGVLLKRDELSGWIGSFDRYSGGKGDAAHWLSMHNGESILFDRKTGPTRLVHVKEAAVWVVGGIQPGILDRVLGAEHRESGLAARLLLAYPPRRQKRWTEAGIDPRTEERLAATVRRLYGLEPREDEAGEPRPVVLTMTAEAKRLYIEFYNSNSRELAELSGDLAAAWSKFEEYAVRFALVIHLTRWAHGDLAFDGSEDNAVDADSMRSAITLCEWFKRETRRVYARLGQTQEQKRLCELVEWIERKGGEVAVREVQQGRRDCKTSADAEALLAELVEGGLGGWCDLSAGPKGGRPSRVFRLSTASTSTQPRESRDSEGFVDVDRVDARWSA